MVETAVTSELLTVLTREPGKGMYGDVVNNLTEFVTIDMLCHALGADAGKAPAGMQTEIRTWMSSQGWENKKVQVGGIRRPGWVRPQNWPAQEPEPTTPAASLPAQADDMLADLSDDSPF